MASPETVFTKKVLKRHGARPDLRLFRNETAGAWVGKYLGKTKEGRVVIEKGRMIQAGLCEGSSDLIGFRVIDGVAVFVALELKVGKDRASKKQKAFLSVVERMGGIAGVCRTMDEVDDLLGEPDGGS